MTLHLRTQDERFCGSRKNFRNPLLVVGLGSAVKAPSEGRQPSAVWLVCNGSVHVSKRGNGVGRPRPAGSYVIFVCQLRPTYSSGCG